MALDTYDNLKLALADWMHRADLTGAIPDYIGLAEARIKALLWRPNEDQVTDLLTAAGVAYVSLPAGFLHARSLSIPNVMPVLAYVTPADYASRNYVGNSAGPREYTLMDGKIYLGPLPDRVYPLHLVYQGTFTPLSPLNQSNSLLAKWPNLYLWAALAEAASYCEDADKAARYEAKFRDALAGINQSEANGPGLLTITTDTRAC